MDLVTEGSIKKRQEAYGIRAGKADSNWTKEVSNVGKEKCWKLQ